MILKQSLLKFFKTGAIPLLLSTIAIRQIILVNTAGLSPWHGGGFGMFASIDRDERRMVTAQIECDPTETLALPGLIAESPEVVKPQTYIHISTFPTDAQLQRLGQLLVTNTPEVKQPIAALASEKPCDGPLQMQAWRLIYEDGAISYDPITEPVEVQP
ncbi:hypothetical protein [Leptothoe kymatousa]|uniref:Uncharacterized protein n=1 Tax=Leptothoe kymatousa TAU-MAC 1615 TaxID=2364775 RepID=A0ABS5Y023_9CYAN|nr:hypothetical protein [Leptothoe kymatousa]MBT9311197.1 hypothetical protein [Leptothoe kymatousa TAU-MAC 1615]